MPDTVLDRSLIKGCEFDSGMLNNFPLNPGKVAADIERIGPGEFLPGVVQVAERDQIEAFNDSVVKFEDINMDPLRIDLDPFRAEYERIESQHLDQKMVERPDVNFLQLSSAASGLRSIQ